MHDVRWLLDIILKVGYQLDIVLKFSQTGAPETVRETVETAEIGIPANPVHYCTGKDDGSDDTDWSYVYFGSYPQTEVLGDDLIFVITWERIK